MPLKKPPSMAPLSMAMSTDLGASYSLSDTGNFSMGNFVMGKHGITQSPLQVGEVSSLRLEDLQIGPRELGRGASSKVYLATHKPSGKQCAVKVLQSHVEDDRQGRHLVLNEVKVAFAAQSDHLISFHDAFLREGSIYLALEYMDVGCLEGLFRTFARPGTTSALPEQVLACILFQILQGLTYLHKERHSVHRDLKPANVLMNSAGFVKLSDFGISKQLGDTQSQAGIA
jgi:serine/threonine protein kinase